MEPIPETTAAVDEYGPFAYDSDLLAELQDKAAAVREIVPACIGLSISSVEDDLTFTLVASDDEIALLDALQYVSSGPCVEAVAVNEAPTDGRDEILSEDDWQLFAQATAANDIASSLTLPIRAGDDVVGSVNLYATVPEAFNGHHERLADIFGAWAPGAVTNADLSFASRRTAEQAPQLLHKSYRLQVAAAILATRYSLDLETAKTRLRDAALRAGITSAQLSESIIDLDHQDS